MAEYSPEFLAALRHGYEETDKPMRALAREAGIGISTLSSLVEKHGWQKRSRRQRGSPAAAQLAEAADLLARLPPRGSGVGAQYVTAPTQVMTSTHVGTPTLVTTPTLALPPAGGGSEFAAAEADRMADSASPDAADGGGRAAAWPPPGAAAPTPDTAARLEMLLEREIASEEATRAELGTLPRLAGEAEQCARRLALLTQTLKTLRAIPAPPPAAAWDDGYDDMPADIDAFRNEFARRIRAFIVSRIGEERNALNTQFAALSNDELKELAAVGRERGMRPFLAPEEPDTTEDAEDADDGD